MTDQVEATHAWDVRLQWEFKGKFMYPVEPDPVQPYTTSLDAALGLVPDRTPWELGNDVGEHWAIVSDRRATAPTAALALCRALWAWKQAQQEASSERE